ncbi:hypothetical protein [Parendozoicomonas sp. Alg238-R29]|uniref:hypothetical protein n=1 Tax=Parendozoicomonas sp. Alg238-R29 TaxID=2993446 RepID=UPI00248EC7B0|nr:hypothetical protein [Parendozoicomonas sp. Alg238-R29]
MSEESTISNLEMLRRVIPSPPAMLYKRVLPELDNYCQEFIRQSSLAVLSFVDDSLGFHFLDCEESLKVAENQELIFTLPHGTRETRDLQNIQGSLYFLVSGIGHGLRVNGYAVLSREGIQFKVTAAYFHCSRAMARANFWEHGNHHLNIEKPCNGKTLSCMALDCIRLSPWLLLRTQNRNGETELSPRGDPAGFVQVLDEKTLLLPERPGNKVAISLTNILDNANVGLAFLVPGQPWVLQVFATARLTLSRQRLELLCIRGKLPKVAIELSVKHWAIYYEEALLNARMWEPTTHCKKTSLTPFSKVIAEHMNGSGVLGKLSAPIVNAVVKKDLKNLY